MPGARENLRCGLRLLALLLLAALPLTACDLPRDPSPYSKGASLQSDVHYVSSRRWKEHGLEWLKAEGSNIALFSEPPTRINRDVTVFVHGFNSPETRVAGYFKDLISYIQNRLDMNHYPSSTIGRAAQGIGQI